MATAEETSWEVGDDDRRDGSSENSIRRSIFAVPVNLTVSIGEVRLSVSEVLNMAPDAVVPLASKIEDLVDLKVDDRVIAKGELVETEEGGLAVKIMEIMEEPDENSE